MKPRTRCDRRRFVQQLGFATASACWALRADARPARHGAGALPAAQRRARRALEIRIAAARAQDRTALPNVRTNGDELRYPPGVGTYTRGLPHDRRGVVAPSALRALHDAIDSGEFEAFEAVPLGKNRRLVNPLAAYAFVLEGGDPQRFGLEPPPLLASREQAAELAALYWMALARDVPFTAYADDPVTNAAAVDLERLTGTAVAPAALFRGGSRGALAGPFISQLLLQDVPFGAAVIQPRIRTTPAALDYGHTVERWLALQNGDAGGRLTYDPEPRFIRNLRDLAIYVHRDFTYQAFLGAAMILTATVGAPSFIDRGNPYYYSRAQTGFATFGEPHLVDLVARVANAALKAAWYHKWVVHRRPRPEEIAGLVQLHRTRGVDCPMHPALYESAALARLEAGQGSALLTQSYPEGSPLHPAYPAGHAAIAGACATVLKAFVNERAEFPDPVDASADGKTRVPYRGEPLTVGGEIDKLAMNISVGRDAAGVHWASDGASGRSLGEAVALSILADMKECFVERSSMSVTCFDGSVRTI